MRVLHTQRNAASAIAAAAQVRFVRRLCGNLSLWADGGELIDWRAEAPAVFASKAVPRL